MTRLRMPARTITPKKHVLKIGKQSESIRECDVMENRSAGIKSGCEFGLKIMGIIKTLSKLACKVEQVGNGNKIIISSIYVL